MPRDIYVTQRCQEIEFALSDAKSWSISNAKLGAYLAGYLTVVMTGVVEDCVEYLVGQRAARAQDLELRAFISKMAGEHFRNPDYAQIARFLRAFSESYRDNFSAKIPPNGSAASALNSVVDNKNSLGHVGIFKFQVTVGDMEDYYHRIIPLLETLEDILL